MDLAERVREWGAVPMFVTQSRGDSKVVDGKIMGLETTRTHVGDVHVDGILGRLVVTNTNGVDYYLMLSLFNRAMLQVCRAVEGICIDLAGELQFQTGDFYHHTHNASRGTERIGAYLFRKLRERLIAIPDR